MAQVSLVKWLRPPATGAGHEEEVKPLPRKLQELYDVIEWR